MRLKQNTDDRRWTDNAETQAEVFGHVRQAHQMETTERLTGCSAMVTLPVNPIAQFF